jgi:hypothetical protein
MSQRLESRDRSGQRGKLRIGNDWNAITIIDFVYAARNKSLKLRYLIRLYCKELVLNNFVGPADQLLERMVELSLRTEENL